MAKSGKDDAVSIPIDDANTGAEAPSSSPTCANDSATAADAKLAAEGAAAEALEAEVLEGEPEEAEKPAEDAEDAEGEKPADDAKAEAEKAAAELAAAKAEAAEWKDKFMRLHAEWDTYRRRTNEQREAEKVRAAEKLVTSLLPVIDDFERTIDYAEKNGEGELLGGVRAVHSKFVGVLEKDGVEVIDPAGEAFDALEAQAVATVPDTEAFDETVHEVYQKGYRLGAKVIRPAMVTVTTGGPKRPKPEEDETEE
ncbi:nucleotide exchange factor GrpE [uncultured Ellagibacter sp.]|uniref:nucleotide exchange factor GrpE n=1 Tax=uncultured Ellagibacter sp. TaxID=2137580 RepID=UPI0025E3C4F6|nr:nucleotide exchange factor GrpE [uncultured Ellagibacter sp.]